jgi:hypothetical protein
VADLMHKFKTMRGIPNLQEMDVEAITGCIKKFLRDLRVSTLRLFAVM